MHVDPNNQGCDLGGYEEITTCKSCSYDNLHNPPPQGRLPSINTLRDPVKKGTEEERKQKKKEKEKEGRRRRETTETFKKNSESSPPARDFFKLGFHVKSCVFAIVSLLSLKI